MLAARITLPHFSVSSANCFWSCAGVIGIGMLPSSASHQLPIGQSGIDHFVELVPIVLLCDFDHAFLPSGSDSFSASAQASAARSRQCSGSL